MTVTGTNDGPTAVADTASTAENTIATIDVLANDSDPDTSDTLSITAANITGGNGSVSIGSNQLQYDPGSNYDYLAVGESATVTIDYTISDGNGGTDTATATVTVTGSNDGPTAVADAASTAENTIATIDVLANDSDPDTSDTLSITAANITGGNGSVSIVSGQLQYDPGSNYDYLAVGESVTVTIDYTISDGNGGTDTATATVTVTGTNDGPSLSYAANETGISLNTDGGNNAYLYTTDGGDILGGLSAFTIEVQFSSTQAAGPYIPLFSYHAGGASDEIEFSIDNGPDGDFYLEVGGQATVVSGFDATTLLDGADHQVSLTWDNTTGSWEIFIDGNSEVSGSGIATGQTIAAGGTITLGQEQDSLGGGFSTVQHFDGTLKDVRIFDDVRTAGEISTNSLSDVSSSESGLIADWKMDDLSGGVTTDAVSGNNLTVGNVTGSGWTSSTPTLYTDIAENAAGGTVIGTLSATDPDTSDTLTYSISSDPSGKFEVVNNELRLKSGQTLDYETATSYDVDLQVSDGNGGTDTVTVTVDVSNVVEPPSDITFASSSTVTTSMQPGTVVSTASAVVEGSATYSLTYSLTDNANGRYTISTATPAKSRLRHKSYRQTTPTYSQQTGASNPFDGFDVGIYADPSLADIDGDGDLDMFVGDWWRTMGTSNTTRIRVEDRWSQACLGDPGAVGQKAPPGVARCARLARG